MTPVELPQKYKRAGGGGGGGGVLQEGGGQCSTHLHEQSGVHHPLLVRQPAHVLAAEQHRVKHMQRKPLLAPDYLVDKVPDEKCLGRENQSGNCVPRAPRVCEGANGGNEEVCASGPVSQGGRAAGKLSLDGRNVV